MDVWREGPFGPAPRGWSPEAARFETTFHRTMKLLATNNKKAGFSLVELTIVVIILGVLATFAVPRFMRVVERTKASESFAYLAEIQSAQARYNAENGEYAQATTDLDIELLAPNHFTVGAFSSADWETEWGVTLTRNGASSGYGAYTVEFNQDGFDTVNSTIPAELIPFN
jgi:prepilin-type N-terminal cleavage/methylation domain-containing protein